MNFTRDKCSENKPDENKLNVDKPDENKLSVKEGLEAKGMQQVKKLNMFGPQTVTLEDSLTTIIQNGFDEFKKETGRQMTYSEMRELYG